MISSVTDEVLDEVKTWQNRQSDLLVVPAQQRELACTSLGESPLHDPSNGSISVDARATTARLQSTRILAGDEQNPV
jgi:hypothetical protein